MTLTMLLALRMIICKLIFKEVIIIVIVYFNYFNLYDFVVCKV